MGPGPILWCVLDFSLLCFDWVWGLIYQAHLFDYINKLNGFDSSYVGILL